jgi:hypothetical protein
LLGTEELFMETTGESLFFCWWLQGFSSSLMRPTATDVSEAVLPLDAKIFCVDRVKGPFNPSSIEYIEEGKTWDAFSEFLKSQGF